MLEATQKEKNNNNNVYIFQNNTLGELSNMKNISNRKDGRKIIRIQKDKIIYTRYAKNEKEAKTKRKELLLEIKNNQIIKIKYNFHEWLDNWYITYKQPFIKDDTAKKLKRILDKIKNGIKNLELTKVNTQIIQNYLNTIQTSRTKEFITLYLNASLQKAEDLNIITKNPFKSVVKDKKLNNIREGYNLEEQKQILKAIKGTEIEPIILIYLVTGIRKSEIETIDLEKDLNIENKTIRILSEKKRDKKNLYRVIDLTQETINLFINNKDKLKLKSDYIYRQFKIILDKLNIRSGLHLLRHTFATNHFYLGTPLKFISSWLGHETIELTQNIYTHIDRTIKKENIVKLYNNLYYQI